MSSSWYKKTWLWLHVFYMADGALTPRDEWLMVMSDAASCHNMTT
jgi:hypothetical protein